MVLGSGLDPFRESMRHDSRKPHENSARGPRGSRTLILDVVSASKGKEKGPAANELPHTLLLPKPFRRHELSDSIHRLTDNS